MIIVHVQTFSYSVLISYQGCLIWSEVSIHEATKKYLSASSSAKRQEWYETLTQLMEGMLLWVGLQIWKFHEKNKQKNPAKIDLELCSLLRYTRLLDTQVEKLLEVQQKVVKVYQVFNLSVIDLCTSTMNLYVKIILGTNQIWSLYTGGLYMWVQ